MPVDQKQIASRHCNPIFKDNSLLMNNISLLNLTLPRF